MFCCGELFSSKNQITPITRNTVPCLSRLLVEKLIPLITLTEKSLYYHSLHHGLSVRNPDSFDWCWATYSTVTTVKAIYACFKWAAFRYTSLEMALFHYLPRPGHSGYDISCEHPFGKIEYRNMLYCLLPGEMCNSYHITQGGFWGNKVAINQLGVISAAIVFSMQISGTVFFLCVHSAHSAFIAKGLVNN